jgi:hypothetical protein
MKKDIITMAVDLAHNSVGEFSAEDVNASLRKRLFEIAGTDNLNYKTMRRFKPEVFQVIEEALDILIVEGLEDQFNDFVEIRNLGWGDTNLFLIEDPALFNVATVANGTGNLRRQRLDNGTLTVETGLLGIKIYEEFYRFLAGRIDWGKMVNKVSKSYNNKIATMIYDAVYDSFDNLGATYGISGAFSESTMNTLIGHVEAATGMNAHILGTKTSLAKINTAVVSEKAKETFNDLGHYGGFNGTPMQAIKQAHIPGTNNFAINDSFVMVLPQVPDKMIKLVIEGDAIIQETPGGQNADMSLEYTFIKSAGIAVIHAAKYGIYRFA